MIDEADGSADWIRKANALIRRAFRITPEDLSPEQWRELYCEAVWLDQRDREFIVKILEILFKGRTAAQ